MTKDATRAECLPRPCYSRPMWQPARAVLLAAVTAGIAFANPAAASDEYAAARERMLGTIRSYAKTSSIASVREAGIDPRVLAAMRAVPRHEFVPDGLRDVAYADRPVPIGHGQTVSQPYIVALMSHLLRAEPGARILEIGTGSGYQAAVLAEMNLSVATIEIIPELARQAAQRFERLGYAGVMSKTGDGYFGWADHAPYDGILVTAAASHIPPPLVEQLKPGGRMVIPVGGPFSYQQLVLVEKLADGGTRTRQLLPVRFVPLLGDH